MTFLAVLLMLVSACSQAEVHSQTSGSVIVRGEITVKTEDDAERDFSGITLSIVESTDGITRDTVLNAVTDIDGRFNVVVWVSEKGTYPLMVSRNNRVVHVINVVLAPGDTVSISGELPDLPRTMRVSSFENDAMATYERLQRLYGRVATFAYSGRVDTDTVPSLMNQWSDYFWSLREEYPKSYASQLASIDAIEILEGWNDARVIERIGMLENDPVYLPVKVIYGGHLHARTEGLDAGLRFLDNLKTTYGQADQRISIDMRKIELLVDYAEYDRAVTEVKAQKQQYRNDEEFQVWADGVIYQLENLLPGRSIPDFSLPLNETTILAKENHLDSYYMVEVVLLADANYQATYPELSRIFRAIPEGKVKFYTLPLDNSQITINAFFEERTKRWTFANARVLDDNNFLEVLRIEQVPTRYLVGPNGQIVGRYIGHDLSGLESAILNIIES